MTNDDYLRTTGEAARLNDELIVARYIIERLLRMNDEMAAAIAYMVDGRDEPARNWQ